MYIYHRVPKNLEGSILFPLNALKEKYPLIYKDQVSKYVGREHLLDRRIPLLDCLWNDVLHFSAVHPKEIKQALIDAGDTSDFNMQYFQVASNLIDPKNAVVYLYAHPVHQDGFDVRDFIPYNPGKMHEFSAMPQATKEYYREMISGGKKPLLYHKIPHILYRGFLDTSGLSVVSI